VPRSFGNRRKGKRVATPDGLRVFGKSANGEGSVYRRADGRWCATWWVPGERRPRRATGKTQQEAIDRRAKRREQSGIGLRALSTVGALADWWLHNVHRHAVRPSSWVKAEDRVRKIKEDLAAVPVADLDYRLITEWPTKLSRTLAPRTVRHHRQVVAQVVEAVKMGALVGNPVRAVRPLRVDDSAGVALDQDETRALLAAVADHRLGAAVALLFLQGWRVSEVLGLAWEDVDLEAGTAHVRRASVYVDGRGQQLGPPKTVGAHGEHWLVPTTVALLRRRQEFQAEERAVAPIWETMTYAGEPVGLVFTTPVGGLVLRQTIAKVIKQGAKTAGIAAELGTHAGRRTVVTTLFVDGDEALEDIAHFVGHARPATTAGYVKRLGRRPEAVAKRAAAVLEARAASTAEAPEGFGMTLLILGATVGATVLHRGQSRRTPPGRKPWSGAWRRTGADPSGPSGRKVWDSNPW
jgi:integrase